VEATNTLAKARIIAIIDADPSVRHSLESLVQPLSFQVECFVSAAQFLGCNHMRDTACLIFDVHTPGMGGLQLQSHLASARLHVPIILITASPNERTQAEAVRAGALPVVHKPSWEGALLREIRSVLRLEGKDKRSE
jgi:FixJ family two-component response regulator